MKFKVSILNFLMLVALSFVPLHIAYSQTSNTASILPPAKTTYFDKNGKPLAFGTVDFYIPGTTTPKTTWQDAGKTIPNTNPVVLDNAGRAIILGSGSYRQIVRDKNNNLIWDQVTSSAGSGGGGTSTIGDGDPVGIIKAWSGFVAPYGYVFAYGQEFARSSYPELFQAITYKANVNCTLNSPILTGIADTSQLSIGSNIESLCLNNGTTIISKTTSTITVSSNAIITSNAIATFFPFGNGDGVNTFTLPDLRGRVVAGRDNMGGISANRLTPMYFNTSGLGVTGGSDNHILDISEIPSHAHNIFLNDPGHNHTTIIASNRNGQWQQGTSVVTGWYDTTNNTTGISSTGITLWSLPGGTGTQNSTSNVGGGLAHSIVQPTQIYNYVIKVLPDTNPNSYFGVASLGGMSGIITCGYGVSCSGNNISVAPGGFSDVTIINSSTYTIAPMISAIAINENAPTFTTLNLPSVNEQNLIPIHIVDWSNPLVGDHVITLTPYNDETIMRLPSWKLYSNINSRSVVTLYPSPSLNGWYIQ